MATQSRRFSMSQWDVFSSVPLAGNSLAVFSDARGLSDSEMQAIAQEMNLSETTFIFHRLFSSQRECREGGGARIKRGKSPSTL